MNKLRECPFCGKQSVEIATCMQLEECAHFEECPAAEPYVCMVCSINKGGCGASTGYYDSAEKANAAWNRRAQPSEKPEALTLMLGGGKYWIADYVCADSGDVGICAYPRESDDGVIGAADSSCVGKSTDDVGAVLKIEFSKLESIDVVIRALEKAKANYRSKPKEEV